MENETKYSYIDIDLNEFDKESLICLISYAHLNNETFEKTIVRLLEEALKDFAARS